jgi:hypothetical protein
VLLTRLPISRPSAVGTLPTCQIDRCRPPVKTQKSPNFQRKTAFSFESWLFASLAGENSLLGRPAFPISSHLCWLIPAKSQANFITSRLLASYRRRKSRFQGGICESKYTCGSCDGLKFAGVPCPELLESVGGLESQTTRPTPRHPAEKTSAADKTFHSRFGHIRAAH